MNEANNVVKISGLTFEPRATVGGQRAVVNYDNGYQASVITGGWAYSTEDEPYEIAVMCNYDLCYDTHITNDILGYLTEEAANEVLQQIAALPNRWENRNGK